MKPTSALDPMAEATIYRNFAELVGKGTALLISHRLGIASVSTAFSCSMAAASWKTDLPMSCSPQEACARSSTDRRLSGIDGEASGCGEKSFARARSHGHPVALRRPSRRGRRKAGGSLRLLNALTVARHAVFRR